MERRDFTKLTFLASGALLFSSFSKKDPRFFSLKKQGSGWTLLAPNGRPFYSLGINHLSNAVLKYPENQHIWYEKYGNSQKKWLKAVHKNLKSWGFNTVGWTADVVTKEKDSHKHSRPYTYEEYQWLDMPYCHRLPFAEIHHYESDVKNPDFFSKGFAEWCDYVAREYCTQFARDEKLIGYFYADCPAWIHTRKEAAWKGPLFDPELLETESGKKELFRIATKYYQTCHDAIRRYDKHHLILGDRYEAKRPWSKIVFDAAKPYVDVISFQFFASGPELEKGLNEFARLTAMPILLADFGVPDYSTWEQGYISNDWKKYGEVLRHLPNIPANIGAHFCGAYLRNRQRKYGILDERDEANPLEINLLKKEHKAFLSKVLK